MSVKPINNLFLLDIFQRQNITIVMYLFITTVTFKTTFFCHFVYLKHRVKLIVFFKSARARLFGQGCKIVRGMDRERKDKTMADKLMYIPNSNTQKYPSCRLQLVVETFGHSTL